MKKRLISVTMLTLLLTSMLILTLSIQSVNAEPKTWHVDDDGEADFSKIQDAVNAAEPGDRIYVYNGIYYENVVVNKLISIVGENRNTTIIDGNWSGTVVNIIANGVSISGFTIRRSGTDPIEDSGIILNSSTNIVIRGNIIIGNTFGIWLENVSNSVIDENVIANSTIYYGIFLGASESNVLSGNLIVNNAYGIWLERFSNKNVIRRNNVAGNIKGIRFAQDSERNTVYDNIITENDDGIDVSSSFNNIHENLIEGNINGIFSFVTLEGNIIFRNNFIDNSRHVNLASSVGVWDNGAEGNYWSGYTGEDADKNGIIDNSYIIDENNMDTYPLIEPWSRFRVFNVSSEGETYYVTTSSNSTIANFNYNFSLEEVNFNVTGPSGAYGFFNITIPKILVETPRQVLINRRNMIDFAIITGNSTHNSVYSTFSFSTHRIKISGFEPSEKIPPIADAGNDQTVNEDTPVTLNGSASWDNIGIIIYEWTFTDESPKTLTGKNVTYIFYTPGVYNITLTVVDASGNWDTDTVEITVQDITKPIADAGQDKVIVVGASVSFDASNSWDNVGIVSYKWDFGDEANGSGISTLHIYSNPGTYNVTLTVKDEAGNFSTDSITVQVLSYFEAFAWWIFGGIVLIGIGVGVILYWRYRVSKTPSNEDIHGNVKK